MRFGRISEPTYTERRNKKKFYSISTAELFLCNGTFSFQRKIREPEFSFSNLLFLHSQPQYIHLT